MTYEIEGIAKEISGVSFLYTNDKGVVSHFYTGGIQSIFQEGRRYRVCITDITGEEALDTLVNECNFGTYDDPEESVGC